MVKGVITAAAFLGGAVLPFQADAFISGMLTHQSATTVSSAKGSMMMATREGGASGTSRKGFFETIAGQAAGISLALTIAGRQPAQAAGLSKVNNVLAGYGLPPIIAVPSGFSPLVEVYGKYGGVKKERDPLVVQFFYPSLWVPVKPSVDKNGEEGTISAGDYQKGDSAAFFVGEGPGGKLSDQSDSYLGDIVVRAITQKSANVYQNFKVLKKEEGPKGPNGAQYYLVEFKYELLTGAGFTVDRKGWASVTQVGKNVQALWTATTATRFKKLSSDLKIMAESFRVYDGIPQDAST